MIRTTGSTDTRNTPWMRRLRARECLVGASGLWVSLSSAKAHKRVSWGRSRPYRWFSTKTCDSKSFPSDKRHHFKPSNYRINATIGWQNYRINATMYR